jgi:hypothetical protein
MDPNYRNSRRDRQCVRRSRSELNIRLAIARYAADEAFP